MEDIRSPNFWESRYQEGTARWDLGQPAPAFQDFLSYPHAPQAGKTMVLGCGRGYDALLFARQGFEVTGVDFAPSAIASAKKFATQEGIAAQFLQRDIFDLPQELGSVFNFVVEHTCFCALPPEKRQDYVQLLASLLQPGGELLAVFFTHNRSGGPPFGITPSEIRQLFGTKFEILTLQPVSNSVPSRQGEEHFGRLRLLALTSD